MKKSNNSKQKTLQNISETNHQSKKNHFMDRLWILFILFYFISAVIYITTLWRQSNPKETHNPHLKATPALILVVTCFLEYFLNRQNAVPKYTLSVALFLLFCKAGDYMLALDGTFSFGIGAFCFGIAHLILADAMIAPPFGSSERRRQFLFGIFLVVGFFYIILRMDGFFPYLMGLYIFLVIRSTYYASTRVGFFTHDTFATNLAKYGMILFLFSDVMLGASEIKILALSYQLAHTVILVTYWVGILLVAYSVRDQWPSRSEPMITKRIELSNWFGDIHAEPPPAVIVRPTNKEEIISILADTKKYPSPVRAVGSNHSITACATANNGTIIEMTRFNNIIDLKNNIVYAEAGALYIDVGNYLLEKGYQFHVNTELGNLTMGSAATCGTKDSSFPDEYGQINSYCQEITLIKPNGEEQTYKRNSYEDFPKLCSSYGLCGIVTRVGFLVKPNTILSVHYEVYTTEQFKTVWPNKINNPDHSYMFYLFPHEDHIAIEVRKDKKPNKSQAKPSPRYIALPWHFRNYMWATFTPAFGHYVWLTFSASTASWLINTFNKLTRWVLLHIPLLVTGQANPFDQQIRYPVTSNNSRYTFTFWAFPEEDYPNHLVDYYKFCKDHFRKTGYRCDMLNVGYHIAKDQNNNYLSYSRNGGVATIDPVSTGKPGWKFFLTEYNKWCLERGKPQPLLNQTWGLDYNILVQLYGEKHLKEYRRYIMEFDPEGRLLSPYYISCLGFNAESKKDQ